MNVLTKSKNQKKNILCQNIEIYLRMINFIDNEKIWFIEKNEN